MALWGRQAGVLIVLGVALSQIGVLLTHQHHVLDVLTGYVLALAVIRFLRHWEH